MSRFLLALLPTLLAAQSFDPATQSVLNSKCVACHGAFAPQGKLDLRTPAALLAGGASGPAIVPGNAAKSLLLDKIVTGQMPPGKNKLSAAEIDTLRAWIDKVPVPAVVTANPVDEYEVRGILQARCVACHGSGKQEGGLDLRTLASRLKGGKSGPALVPGQPEKSLLYTRIVAGQMPPEKPAKALAIELPTEAETEKIRAWIAAGAPAPREFTLPKDVSDKDRLHWSFQPPQRPALPAVKQSALVHNPIDRFLLAKLEAKGLSYSPEASPLTLLRRAHLDLTGLPPTPAEIQAFLADQKPGAYERLIDRLLASPHYGERWGQHWLDLAGYSDSEGFGQDDGVRRFAWRYRDYVIRALNSDKPYNQFLTEQLAGDELSDDWKKTKTASQELIDRLAATGFLRTTPDPTNSNERGLLAERMNVISDELEVLSSSVMGLTIGCARCHNHKYDPIPQRDHYRLSSILQAAYDPYEWRSPNKRELDLALATEREAVETHNAPLEAQLKKLRDRLSALTAQFKKDTQLSDGELEKQFPEYKEQAAPLKKEIDELRRQLKPKPHVRVLTDNAEPSTHFLLRRGDPATFGEPVEAGPPAVLNHPALQPYKVEPPFPGTSGRRLALAKWLTQPNHPLTARVAVNQIWLRHFGRGIVPTVANFGRSGLAPSHPELLDWLAVEFVERGWSMKSLHRLIMTSRAYRQSSAVNPELLAADPENALVSRMPLRRMDAETLFDSLVSASGRLDATAFGPPSELDIRPDKEVTVKAGPQGFRRSIYILHRRQTPVSLMDAFDQPSMTPNCTERRRSNVSTQALHLMNGSMAWELARYFAGRVIDEAGPDLTRQVEQIYLRALSRRPTAEESKLALAAIEEFRAQWPARLAADNNDAPRAATAQWLALANFTHAILNSAEFSFID